MSLSMRGTSGQVKNGYQVAAQLGPWTLDGSRVEAVVHQVNTFWLHKAGRFSLALRVGEKTWTWGQVEIADEGAPFVIHVSGSPEVRDVR